MCCTIAAICVCPWDHTNKYGDTVTPQYPFLLTTSSFFQSTVMRFSLPVLLSIIAVAYADQAPKNTDNVKGTIAVADFPKGMIVFYVKKGSQVKVHVDITGLPESGGPFQYHIHDQPIPSDGNCEAAGPHFNPYAGPANCGDQRDDSYCQVGDLSGKHGWIDTTCFETKYYDPYLSLNSESPAYIVGKSVVFHYDNLTKFACANIELVLEARSLELMQLYREKGDLEFGNFDVVDEADMVVNAELADVSVQLQGLLLLRDNAVVAANLNATKDDSKVSYDGVDIVPIATNNTASQLNYTNATVASVVSTDCESGAGARSRSILTAALAMAAGFLI